MAHGNRKTLDCRQTPSEFGCSLTISGTEQEVLRVATRHAVEDHGERDSPQLQVMLKGSLRDDRSTQQLSEAETDARVGMH